MTIQGISINNSAIVFDTHVWFVRTPQVRNNRVDLRLTISVGTETLLDYPCGNRRMCRFNTSLGKVSVWGWSRLSAEPLEFRGQMFCQICTL